MRLSDDLVEQRWPHAGGQGLTGGWHCSALFLGIVAFLSGAPLGDPFGVCSGQYWLTFFRRSNQADLM
ncbi:hypothetical protein ACIQPR_45200 [Streptomyces sp. NPDC091280]|uniref:hypothetical protein n=1 Tax=Streptomyces sp. NPDC091280 TaxID=3365984 RepID=UPI0037FAAF52